MTKGAFVALLMLAACGNQGPGNAMTNAAESDGPMPAGAPPLPKPAAAACAKPKLDLRAARLDAARAARFTDNFTVAFDKACAQGLIAKGPLVDPQSGDPSTLFVMDAPEANIVSIYFNPESTPQKMTLLEAPFGRGPDVPSIEDIHEAIYCRLEGATKEEMETSGRCLPD